MHAVLLLTAIRCTFDLSQPKCCRELITSEIVFWLYQILTGNDKEFLAWPAASSFTTRRKQLGLGSGSLQDWIQDLLQKVIFKVNT